MMVYFQAAPLAGVPKALLERRAFEFVQKARFHGVQLTNTADGENDGIRAILTRNATAEKVIAWLAEANVACVDVDPEDVPILAASFHGVDRLVLQKGIAQGLPPRLGLMIQRVTPEELIDNLARVAEALQVVPTSQKSMTPRDAALSVDDQEYLNKHDEAEIVAEMRKAGINVPDVPSRFDELPHEEEPTREWDEHYGVNPSEDTQEFSETDDWGPAY